MLLKFVIYKSSQYAPKLPFLLFPKLARTQATLEHRPNYQASYDDGVDDYHPVVVNASHNIR